MMKRKFLFFLLLLFFCGIDSFSQSIDLSGTWRFRLDPEDKGLKEIWYKQHLPDEIRLPGSLQERGYGDEVSVDTPWTGEIVDKSWYTAPEYAPYRKKGNVKVPFWLTPDKYYAGAAWYQRDFTIPEDWKDDPVLLTMERLHWESTVYLDGVKIGKSDALLVPHEYILNRMSPGRHTLTVRVDNRMIVPLGSNAHSVSDHTQGNWNGITGRIVLERKPAVYIDDIQIYPDIHQKSIAVKMDFKGSSSSQTKLLTLQAFDAGGRAVSPVRKEVVKLTAGSHEEFSLQLDEEVSLWSEFTPEVYRLCVTVQSREGSEMRNVDFGLREITTRRTRFAVNGIPVFLRGTLECCIFPLTGYPPTDEAYWKKIYSTCRSYGLNHVRFHSWCPPEAAFKVADRMGFYLHVECGAWATIGVGGPQDTWFYQEADRIIRAYGNHPSFCMMAYGNEPYGNADTYLQDFVAYLKQKDNRRVYTGGAGWPYIPNADYYSNSSPRLQVWNAQLKSIINSQSPSADYDWWEIIRKDMPMISHEIGQWCAFPDFKEIRKYTGVLKAKNFEIFQETLERKHMADLADEFLYASGRLQTLCYKADIEAALRTPHFAGFQLLDLHDFPGQGSALVGVLNAFWESKGYVDGKEYSMFCNRTVPLARLQKMVFRSNEYFKVPLEFAHFDAAPMKNARIWWKIQDKDGKFIRSGSWVKDLPIDNSIWVGNMECDFNGITAPQALTLTAGIEGTSVMNYWNIWVYPEEQEQVTDLPYMTNVLDEKAVRILQNGGDVLLCPARGSLRPEKGGDVKVGFSSIFWNTAWTRKQAPHTMGIYCDPKHPALSLFPTEKYSDYQWWDILSDCEAIVMDDFPADYRPVVHLIDDWFTSRKLGLVFEAKVSNGKLLVCGADLIKKARRRPARDQFKQSLLHYMASEEFNPQTTLKVSDIRQLFR